MRQLHVGLFCITEFIKSSKKYFKSSKFRKPNWKKMKNTENIYEHNSSVVLMEP